MKIPGQQCTVSVLLCRLHTMTVQSTHIKCRLISMTYVYSDHCLSLKSFYALKNHKEVLSGTIAVQGINMRPFCFLFFYNIKNDVSMLLFKAFISPLMHLKSIIFTMRRFHLVFVYAATRKSGK